MRTVSKLLPLARVKDNSSSFVNCLKISCILFSPTPFLPRSVRWVRHRGGRAPLVQTQCLSALWHGHLHGPAGAAEHGDRVSKTRWLCCGCTSQYKLFFPTLMDGMPDNDISYWENLRNFLLWFSRDTFTLNLRDEIACCCSCLQ